MCNEDELQWLLFSVISLHIEHWNFAWIDPPINESTRLPILPVIIIKKINGIVTFHIKPTIAIIVAPNMDPIVPRNDIAPEVPFGTLINFIIWKVQSNIFSKYRSLLNYIVI